MLEALDYVGVLAVELFVTRDWHGREGLVVNEIAPRVHNSGHWTLDGAQTSQFEQHIRAISGWPLGAPTRRGRVEMHNLIGEDAEDWRDILAQPDLCLHLYGKLEIRPDRKMGHVTRVFPEPPAEKERAESRLDSAVSPSLYDRFSRPFARTSMQKLRRDSSVG